MRRVVRAGRRRTELSLWHFGQGSGKTMLYFLVVAGCGEDAELVMVVVTCGGAENIQEVKN